MTLTNELITPDMRTTSRVVAEKFGKRHADVLRGIENTKKDLPDEFSERNLALATYLDAQGKPREQYQLTRDGFTLITMGFTGRAAMEWKVRFIDAFNAMEAELRARAEPADVPPGVDMGHRDWLALVREARLLGGTAAGRRMWGLSPLPPLFPDRASAAPGDGTGADCLRHLLACDTVCPGMTIADLAAAARAGDLGAYRTLARAGLRAGPEDLFVAGSLPHGARLFDGTDWSGGRHRAALLGLPGARPGQLSLAGAATRGVHVPLLSALPTTDEGEAAHV